MKRLLTAAATLLAGTVIAGSALASTVTINPGAIGEGGSTKAIDRFFTGFGATVVQTVNGTTNPFTETGAFEVTSFRLGGFNVNGTGLGSSWGMYGTFNAGGSSSFSAACPNAVCTSTSTFSSFNVSLFVDPDLGTLVDTNDGVVSGTTVGDILVATAVINLSGFNGSTTVIAGAGNSSFDAFLTFSPVTSGAGVGFFQGTLPFSLALDLDGTINGVTGPIGVGVPPPVFPAPGNYNLTVTGGGTGSFPVPAPASLALLGAALAGLGLVRRRISA